MNGKKVGCSHCGQCADEAIGGPLACIVCEREGRYARKRILDDALALLAGNCAGRVLGSGETVEVDMRRAAKVDDNQAEIVDALRRAGCSVCILSGVGRGCPDLAVGLRGVTYLLEIKDGRKSPSKQRLTPDEQAWHDAWRGHATVVRSVDEALDAVGLRPVAMLHVYGRDD